MNASSTLRSNNPGRIVECGKDYYAYAYAGHGEISVTAIAQQMKSTLNEAGESLNGVKWLRDHSAPCYDADIAREYLHAIPEQTAAKGRG